MTLTISGSLTLTKLTDAEIAFHKTENQWLNPAIEQAEKWNAGRATFHDGRGVA
jgi:hypothetical protein